MRPGNEPIRVVTLDSHNDLSDVRDVVRAYRVLLATPHTRGIYNVGSGRNVRSGDVFQQLVELTGRQSGVVERQPGPSSAPDRRLHADQDRHRLATRHSARADDRRHARLFPPPGVIARRRVRRICHNCWPAVFPCDMEACGATDCGQCTALDTDSPECHRMRIA